LADFDSDTFYTAILPIFSQTLHSDGSAPDVRKLIPLDQLTTVQDLHSTVVQLAFRNGDTVRLDFGDYDEKPLHHGDGGGCGSVTNSAVSASRRDEKNVQGALVKERFIWSLLQIHAMLCMSVVERSSHGSSGAPGEVGGGDGENATSRGDRHRRYLPPLNVRNFDRAQLQYVATVNKFLKRSPMLCALLDRQRAFMEVDGGAAGAFTAAGKGEEEKLEMEEMDTLAYSMIMGNFNTRVSLFHSESERKDAEEVLNSAEWTESFHRGDKERDDIAANATAVDMAERLHLLLQFRMRDLEAETCRRLIAWEDEKHYSSTGAAKLMSGNSSKASSMQSLDDARDTVDALALASLFKTLDSLDGDLALMEEWLQDRAAAIKPLTDDCADIEEENRQLEQQWKSYETLGNEMKRLLQGLELNAEAEKLLRNPASYLVYDRDGLVDVERSEAGVEQIYESGKALQEAIEYPRQSGGLHLKAVSERADKLSSITKIFCTQLAQIIVTVMEQFKTEVVAGSDGGKVSKNDTHSSKFCCFSKMYVGAIFSTNEYCDFGYTRSFHIVIAKKIRDTQRKFQSALLGYIKLIEILAAMSPEMLPALRDAYAEMVSEGILMKKRCKGYYQALPGTRVASLVSFNGYTGVAISSRLLFVSVCLSVCLSVCVTRQKCRFPEQAVERH
jgi:Exocyst complex component Sec3